MGLSLTEKLIGKFPNISPTEIQRQTAQGSCIWNVSGKTPMVRVPVPPTSTFTGVSLRPDSPCDGLTDSSAGVAEFSTWRRRITFACQSENASTSSISLLTIRRRQVLESSLQAPAEPVKIQRHLPAGMLEPTSPQLVCFHPQRDGSGQCGTDRLQPSRRDLVRNAPPNCRRGYCNGSSSRPDL